MERRQECFSFRWGRKFQKKPAQSGTCRNRKSNLHLVPQCVQTGVLEVGGEERYHMPTLPPLHQVLLLFCWLFTYIFSPHFQVLPGEIWRLPKVKESFYPILCLKWQLLWLRTVRQRVIKIKFGLYFRIGESSSSFFNWTSFNIFSGIICTVESVKLMDIIHVICFILLKMLVMCVRDFRSVLTLVEF